MAVIKSKTNTTGQGHLIFREVSDSKTPMYVVEETKPSIKNNDAMSSSEINRSFPGSYDDVINKSQSVQPQYMIDQAIFGAFDPTLTTELGLDLKTKTVLAQNDSSASSDMSAISRKTDAIGKQLSNGGKLYQRLLYFAHNGVGENKTVDASFGRSQYKKASKSEKEMVRLLQLSVKTARLEEFYNKMLAAGMTEELLIEIEALATTLAETDNDQEMLKKQKLLSTNERVMLYNSIWDILSKINKASKLVFTDDPARLKIYQLYSGTSGGSNETEEA